jgi:hypothetical protein
MKKLFSLLTLAFVLVFSSCIEQDYTVFEGSVVEFQDAVVRTPVAGQKYPRITVANTVGTVTLRVNLVGAQRTADETLTYTVVPEGTTAVTGRDFTTSGTVVIPAGSSFGDVTVSVLNTGAIGGSVNLLLQIDGNSSIASSQNHNQVQISITRPAPPAGG